MSFSSSSVQDSHDSSSDSSEGIASEEVGWDEKEVVDLNASELFRPLFTRDIFFVTERVRQDASKYILGGAPRFLLCLFIICVLCICSSLECHRE